MGRAADVREAALVGQEQRFAVPLDGPRVLEDLEELRPNLGGGKDGDLVHAIQIAVSDARPARSEGATGATAPLRWSA